MNLKNNSKINIIKLFFNFIEVLFFLKYVVGLIDRSLLIGGLIDRSLLIGSLK